MTEKDYGPNIEKIRDKLYKTALLYMGNPTAAVDILDEAVYKGLRNCRKLKEEKYFSTWMTRIVINECHNEFKRMKRMQPMDDKTLQIFEFIDRIDQYDMEDSAEHLDLLNALSSLPEDLEKILTLRYLSGYTQEETANALKIPQGTVVTKQRKALSMMKEILSTGNNDSALSLTRAKKRNLKRKLIEVPVATIIAIFLGFTTLINISPTVAAACETIPFLKEFKDAFTFNKSLQKAVEHEYDDRLSVSQTVDGITLTVDDIIVDQSQVNILYRITSDDPIWGKEAYSHITSANFTTEDGKAVQTSTVWHTTPGSLTDPSVLQKITLYFSDAVPSHLDMKLFVDLMDPTEDGEEELPRASVSFSLPLDFPADKTANSKEISYRETFTLAGQTFTFDNLSIYPTHMRFDLIGDSSNIYNLNAPDCYFKSDQGETYPLSANGVSAWGNEDSDPHTMVSFLAESPWFDQAATLTFTMEGFYGYPKDGSLMTIDLTTGQVSNKPKETGKVSYDAKTKTITIEAVHHTDDKMTSVNCYDKDGKLIDSTYALSTSQEEGSTDIYELYLPEDYDGDIVMIDPLHPTYVEANETITLTIPLN